MLDLSCITHTIKEDINRDTLVQICRRWLKRRESLVNVHERFDPSRILRFVWEAKNWKTRRLINIQRQQRTLMVQRHIRATTGAFCNILKSVCLNCHTQTLGKHNFLLLKQTFVLPRRHAWCSKPGDKCLQRLNKKGKLTTCVLQCARSPPSYWYAIGAYQILAPMEQLLGIMCFSV